MSDKCFCHLNGYTVKDATARNEIDKLKPLDPVLGGYKDITEELIAWCESDYPDTQETPIVLTQDSFIRLSDIEQSYIDGVIYQFCDNCPIHLNGYRLIILDLEMLQSTGSHLLITFETGKDYTYHPQVFSSLTGYTLSGRKPSDFISTIGNGYIRIGDNIEITGCFSIYYDNKYGVLNVHLFNWSEL